jgi:N-methylhydantoinase B/oxoprolinase/acetone carboxylase alpha subunit
VLPNRVSAHDGGTSALVAIGGVHPETEDVFANLTGEGCGWGGRPTKDGNNHSAFRTGTVPSSRSRSSSATRSA